MTSFGQVIYSNKAGAFCSWHDEDFEASDLKTVAHGNLVCPPETDLKCKTEGGDCMQEKKDRLIKALDTSTHAREHFTFHFTSPNRKADEHERTRKRLRKDTHIMELTAGFSPANFKSCRRNHLVKGISYHHDGEVVCGLFSEPDLFTTRKMAKSPDDAAWEIGYSRDHRLCGVDKDKVFTCRKMCAHSWLPNVGCKHTNDRVDATARFQLFDIKGTRGDFRLEPWQGPPKFSSK